MSERHARAKSAKDPASTGLADRLHSAAIHVLRAARAADEETGLSAARLSALSVLVFAGPRSIGDLARAEQVSAPTMSALVRGLEGDGLLRRKPDRKDGRVVVLEPTARGRKILERGRARRVDLVAGLLDGIGARESGVLAEAAAILERQVKRAGGTPPRRHRPRGSPRR